MKSQYEQKLFEFYTQEENLKAMIDVVDVFPTVANRLLESFWEEVKEHLNEKYPEPDWSVGYSDQKPFHSHDKKKLWIYHESWVTKSRQPVVAIAFESLQLDGDAWIGIFINCELDGYNYAGIKQSIRQLAELSQYHKDGNRWWERWRHVETKINQPYNYTVLSQLITEDRQRLVASMANEAIEMVQLFRNHAKNIIDEHNTDLSI